MIWWAFFLILVMSTVMYFWATELDARKYMDPRMRSQVVEEFRKGMTKKEVKRIYYKTNLREFLLFAGGMIAGAVMGAL